ncbi:hypothetical protein Tsubulata_025774, partial [Turnera subulata]
MGAEARSTQDYPPRSCWRKTAFPSKAAAVLQSRSISFRKDSIRQEDPFFIAFKKCTEQPANREFLNCLDGSKRTKSRRKRTFTAGALSCKYSCNAATDNLVRRSQIPIHISQEMMMRQTGKKDHKGAGQNFIPGDKR